VLGAQAGLGLQLDLRGGEHEIVGAVRDKSTDIVANIDAAFAAESTGWSASPRGHWRLGWLMCGYRLHGAALYVD
jgi:hypothetical protein